MIRSDLDGLPEMRMPDGYELRTYRPGDEAAWAEVMNTGLGDWTADKCWDNLTSKPQFLPDGLFFASFKGTPVGSACAWRQSPDEWSEGYVHMVCVDPQHQGRQLGYMLTLAVLHYFRDHMFRDAVLHTDDHRLPAIKSYLKLGFEPHYYDESHPERWRVVFDSLGISFPDNG